MPISEGPTYFQIALYIIESGQNLMQPNSRNLTADGDYRRAHVCMRSRRLAATGYVNMQFGWSIYAGWVDKQVVMYLIGS